MIDLNTLKQLWRYGVIGLAHNSLSYLVYLSVTWLGLDPKVTVSIFYPIGAVVSFYANRKWTFSHEGKMTKSFVRFVITNTFGYCLNIAMLYYFVDVLSYPHQIIQAIAIVAVAFFLFLMLRFYVFPEQYR